MYICAKTTKNMKNTSAIFGTRLILNVRCAIAMIIFYFTGFTAQAQTTGLPVIRIETQDNASIDSKVDWTNITSFELTDPTNPENNILRENLSSRDRIRGRGNSTWHAPKKPYRVRFRENISLFGHSAAENWVLLANWFDATQGIKNAFAFELGARLNVPFTPSYHPVDLYLNGTYQGTYMLTQHRQIAPNGVTPGPGRVEIDPNNGWLVEMDFRWDEEDEDPKFRTRNFDLPLVMKNSDFPLADYTNQDATNFIVRDWNNFCDLMASGSFPENGYRDLIDMQSIINMFIVQVLTNNHDFNHPGSNFWHKNINGKIAAGPLWDFDLSFGAWHEGMNGTLQDLYYTNPTHNIWARREQAPNVRPNPTYPFFARFLDDPVFSAARRKSWNDNKVAIFSMVDFVDEMADKLRVSTTENYKIWRTDEQVDFDYWVNVLRDYVIERINFLDGVYNEGAPTVHIITAPAAICVGYDLALPTMPNVIANEAIVTSRGWQIFRNNVWVAFANPVTNSDTQLRYFATNARGTSYSNVVNIIINTIPATPVSISGPTSVAAGSNQEYSVETVNGATSYEWTLPTDWTLIGSTTGNSINVTVGAIGGSISVRAVNACGESAWTTLPVTINNASVSVVTGDERTIIAYNNIVQINGLKEGEVVSIYNLLGAKIYSRKTSQDPKYITNLMPGVYTVIIEGTNVRQKVVIVK